MLPIAVIEKFLFRVKPDLRDIVLELRNLIAEAAPQAHEEIRHHSLSYYYEKQGGPVSAGICGIGIYVDHVRLIFIHGYFLPDPEGLLEGERKYMRYVKLTYFESAPWKALKELISESSRLDIRSLG
jgi:hypothetical protein